MALEALTKMDAADLMSELREFNSEGAAVFGPRDSQMALPSLDFLQELFSHLFGVRYTKEAFDCDDFAMRFVVETSLAVYRRGNANCGHAVFLCYLVIAEGRQLNNVRDGYHATNLVRLNNGSWIFFEPQNGRYCDAKTAILDGSVSAVTFVLL